jgi:uncharacterized protein YbbC (DUF1343 family)
MKTFLLVLAVFTIRAEFKLGIENIPQSLVNALCAPGIATALVTNQTGIDQQKNRSIDILLKKGIKISAIFVPEHGIHGIIQASHDVTNSKDPVTNIPIISLYGNGAGKKIDPLLLRNIDIIFFDIQDCGMRHYTYISTLFTVLQAAADAQKKVIVFDRPNPLGKIMEGPLVDPSLISFVSIAAIPLRHGMTVGELAHYFNTHVFEKKVSLQVIPMKNYLRDQAMADLHAPLSPNITSKQACMGYSFLGLLGEIRPFNVGVGTEHSFQLIMLPESLSVPEVIWQELSVALADLGIATTFSRKLNNKKTEYFHGLQICIADINQVIAFKALLATISIIRKAGVSLQFNPIFDKAIGSKQIQKFVNDAISHQELSQEINNGLQSFFKKAAPLFIYTPHPELLFN